MMSVMKLTSLIVKVWGKCVCVEAKGDGLELSNIKKEASQHVFSFHKRCINWTVEGRTLVLSSSTDGAGIFCRIEFSFGL